VREWIERHVVEFLEQFDYVQHLAPWYLEQTVKKMEEKRGSHH